MRPTKTQAQRQAESDARALERAHARESEKAVRDAALKAAAASKAAPRAAAAATLSASSSSASAFKPTHVLLPVEAYVSGLHRIVHRIAALPSVRSLECKALAPHAYNTITTDPTQLHMQYVRDEGVAAWVYYAYALDQCQEVWLQPRAGHQIGQVSRRRTCRCGRAPASAARGISGESRPHE